MEISVPALVVAHATGYAASRRSLPLGGAGVTEALLTLALIWVHVPAPAALLSVATYRLVNFLAPTLPALVAHTSIRRLLHAEADEAERDAHQVHEPAGLADHLSLARGRAGRRAPGAGQLLSCCPCEDVGRPSGNCSP